MTNVRCADQFRVPGRLLGIARDDDQNCLSREVITADKYARFRGNRLPPVTSRPNNPPSRVGIPPHNRRVPPTSGEPGNTTGFQYGPFTSYTM